MKTFSIKKSIDEPNLTVRSPLLSTGPSSTLKYHDLNIEGYDLEIAIDPTKKLDTIMLVSKGGYLNRDCKVPK